MGATGDYDSTDDTGSGAETPASDTESHRPWPQPDDDDPEGHQPGPRGPHNREAAIR
ncbi:hypothetical protein OCAE111667_22955 [Occultella aeris]|uniref:Uncharacterized protein n=1 Tax=Occultella aeris TaxID=2761496 RepID=A0A7M4DLD7_9MICO|nr:hypothetical protein HALOF300_02954 [Occultella aeris]